MVVRESLQGFPGIIFFEKLKSNGRDLRDEEWRHRKNACEAFCHSSAGSLMCNALGAGKNTRAVQ